MRTITQEEIESLPSYPFIERGLYYGSDWATADRPHSRYQTSRKGYPYTRDGYLAVQALYNLSRWSSWKSSSLGDEERWAADQVGNLKLGALMGLNKGRRMNQPALFPEGDLLEGGK